MTATWQAYHQITGAPLTADDAPSTTAPIAARRFVAPSTVTTVLVQLLDGTSATAAVWTCAAGNDPTDEDNWSALDGASGSIGTTIPLPLAVTPGAYITIRLTDVVGNPTNCVVLDFACFQDILKALCTRSALSIDSATLHADVDGVETLLGTSNTLLASDPADSEDVDISATDHTFAITCRELFVSGGGVVKFRLTGDDDDHSITALAGQTLRMKFAKIIKTGTTATGMVGFAYA